MRTWEYDLFPRDVRASQKNKPPTDTAAATRHFRAVQIASRKSAAYGLKAEIIAAICQVDVATARRWKSGKSRIPHAAQALLEGDLGAFSKHWDGWRVRGENIHSPDGWRINRNDALSVPLLLGQLSGKDEQIAKLRAQIEELKDWMQKQEQPAPLEELPKIIA